MQEKTIDYKLLVECFKSLIKNCTSYNCPGWKDELKAFTCTNCRTAQNLSKEFPELLKEIDVDEQKEKEEDDLRRDLQSYTSSWMKGVKKDRCKYVIFDFGTSMFPVLFPFPLSHEEVSEIMLKLRPHIKPVSGGYVGIDVDVKILLNLFRCHGNTVYKSLKTEEDDHKHIALMFKQEEDIIE